MGVPVSEHKQQVDGVTCSTARLSLVCNGASHIVHLLLVFTDSHILQDTLAPLAAHHWTSAKAVPVAFSASCYSKLRFCLGMYMADICTGLALPAEQRSIGMQGSEQQSQQRKSAAL